MFKKKVDQIPVRNILDRKIWIKKFRWEKYFFQHQNIFDVVLDLNLKNKSSLLQMYPLGLNDGELEVSVFYLISAGMGNKGFGL